MDLALSRLAVHLNHDSLSVTAHADTAGIEAKLDAFAREDFLHGLGDIGIVAADQA